VAVGDGTSNLLFLSCRLLTTHTDERGTSISKDWTRVNTKHLWRSTTNNSSLILPVRRLTQVVLQRSTCETWIRILKLMGSLSQIQIASLCHLHLLHVVVLCLHLVCIVVKVLLAASHFLLIKCRVDPYLIT